MNLARVDKFVKEKLGDKYTCTRIVASSYDGNCLFDSFSKLITDPVLSPADFRAIVANQVYTEQHYNEDANFREYLDSIKGMYEMACIKRNSCDIQYYKHMANVSMYLPPSTAIKSMIADLTKDVDRTQSPQIKARLQEDIDCLVNYNNAIRVDIKEAMQRLWKYAMTPEFWEKK